MKNGYSLHRAYFDWAFENPDLSRTNDAALFSWLIELNNRLGWSEKFKITAKECMDACSFKTYRPYKNALDNLVKNGFVNIILQSKNQYVATVISLNAYTKNNKALNKALQKQRQTIGKSNSESTGNIHLNIEPQTNKTINIEFDVFWKLYDKKRGDKSACEKKWGKLSDIAREKIINTLPFFLRGISDKQFQPFPQTYLNQERWEDEIDKKVVSPNFVSVLTLEDREP